MKQADTADSQDARNRFTRKRRISPIYFTIALLVVVGLLFYLGNRNFMSLYNLNTIISFSAILLMAGLTSPSGGRYRSSLLFSSF